MFEWDHLIYSHITARLPDEQEHYLINPYGIQYSEITASSLIKIDIQGNIIDPGSTVLPVNRAGFKLNSALHTIGQNVVYHTHSHAGTAISAMNCGLLNLCQEALIVRPVSYSSYQGFVPNKEEQRQLQEDMIEDSHVIILENHGLVSVGETIEEAFLWMAQLTKACEIQWRVLRCGKDNLHARTFDSNKQFEGDLPVELVCNPNGRVYGTGELEFESYMRMMDNDGMNTGYPYKTPSVFRDTIPSYPAVQYPPIVPGMDGPPSDSNRSDVANQRSAWFRNPVPVEQRISPPEDARKKSDKEPREHGRGTSSTDSSQRSSSRSHSSSGSSGRRRKKKKPREVMEQPPPRPPLPLTTTETMERTTTKRTTTRTSRYSYSHSSSGSSHSISGDEGPSRPPLPVDKQHPKRGDRSSPSSDDSDLPPSRPPLPTVPRSSDGDDSDVPSRPQPPADTHSSGDEDMPVTSGVMIMSDSRKPDESGVKLGDPTSKPYPGSDGESSQPPFDTPRGGDSPRSNFLSPRKSPSGESSPNDDQSSHYTDVGPDDPQEGGSSEDSELSGDDHSSESTEGGYHSTKSDDETPVAEFITEHHVEREVFVDGVPVPVETSLGSSVVDITSPTLLSDVSCSSESSSDVENPSSDGRRSDEPMVESLSDDSFGPPVDRSTLPPEMIEHDLPSDSDDDLPVVEADSLGEEEMPEVEMDNVTQVEDAGDPGNDEDEPAVASFAGKPNLKRPKTDHMVGVPPQTAHPLRGDEQPPLDTDEESHVPGTRDSPGSEDSGSELEEIRMNTVTAGIIEITETQEDTFEVITIRPGQLTQGQKNQLISEGYILQEI